MLSLEEELGDVGKPVADYARLGRGADALDTAGDLRCGYRELADLAWLENQDMTVSTEIMVKN